MASLLRRFRGLAIALAVLALSAGAAFAAAPSMIPAGSHADRGPAQAANADPSESESAEPSESVSTEPTTSPEPTESPEPPAGAQPSEAPGPSAAAQPAASPMPDTHGALVSTAARLPTPSGFPNHGAFVSCVAHLRASAATFDWATVTPASCGIDPSGMAKARGHGQTTKGQGSSTAKGNAATSHGSKGTGH